MRRRLNTMSKLKELKKPKADIRKAHLQRWEKLIEFQDAHVRIKKEK